MTKIKKIIFSAFAAALFLVSNATFVFAADIDREAAEKLAADFLEDIFLQEIYPEDHAIDFTKYTSVEKFAEYMELHMKWVSDYYQLVGGSGYGTSYDEYTFETEATDFEDVDGGILLTMHIKRFYHYIGTDEWGGGENSVYVLVAEGESGPEIRDYNNPHTGWDGIRGDSFIPTDPDYWISDPNIEAALEHVRKTGAEGLEIYAKDHARKDDQLSESIEAAETEQEREQEQEPNQEPSPKTGVSVSVVVPIVAMAVMVGARDKRKNLS